MLLKLLYLCYLLHLVEAGAVDVAAAVTAGLASYVVAAVLVVSAVDVAGSCCSR